ncbi:hypothetical protein [uncultured Oscillibacter sp.]|uniref:hypothetical protein n=1 Tax=uncultured Oscillibacter sp. TaxID=876091 RepID=UPI00262280F7|nr:hypothetical protein [uncultured Oscillibacter sp.]
MPIQNGKYVSPNWQNGGPPALNAAELNAICQSLQADDQQIKDNLPGIIQSIASGVFLNSSGQLVNKAGSQITVPSSQLSDQVHIVTGSYVGTGTYGVDHPCSLTFNFLPKLIMITRYHTGTSSIDYIFPGDSEGNYWLMDTSLIPTSETSKWSDYIGTGLGMVYGYGGGSSIGYKSLDGKTAYWYSGSDAASQFNSDGTTYYYAAIG